VVGLERLRDRAVDGALQSAAKVALLISADSSRAWYAFSRHDYWPWAMAVAAPAIRRLPKRRGAWWPREAKMVGINHIYAPVADVNVDPTNPVINTRSFGEDPADVSRFVAGFVRA